MSVSNHYKISRQYFHLNTINVANNQSLVQASKNSQNYKIFAAIKGLLGLLYSYKTPLEYKIFYFPRHAYFSTKRRSNIQYQLDLTCQGFLRRSKIFFLYKIILFHIKCVFPLGRFGAYERQRPQPVFRITCRF